MKRNLRWSISETSHASFTRAVDERCALARREGRLRLGPNDSGYPVGYWGLIADPDGHTLEISYGQEVGLATESASR